MPVSWRDASMDGARPADRWAVPVFLIYFWVFRILHRDKAGLAIKNPPKKPTPKKLPKNTQKMFFFVVFCGFFLIFNFFMKIVRHVTGNDEDYLRKIPRVVVQKSALL
jgi:hypothetical protein